MRYRITLLNKQWYYPKKSHQVDFLSWFRMPIKLVTGDYRLNPTEFWVLNRVISFYASSTQESVSVDAKMFTSQARLTTNRLQTCLVNLEQKQLLRVIFDDQREKEKRKKPTSSSPEEIKAFLDELRQPGPLKKIEH